MFSRISTWYLFFFRALVFICHGYGEHCLWYNEVAEMLVKQGFFVFGHDHMGHGQSQGDRGDITDFTQYTRDVFKHIEDVRKEVGGDLPVYILGHSMGGAITILASLERPDFFAGLVLIGPAVVPSSDAIGPVRVFLGKLVAKVIPQMVVVKLDPNLISRDPEIVKRYNDDPLVIHFGIKARWGVSLLKTLQRLEKECCNVQCPFLVLHGDQDKYCDMAGSQKLYDEAKSKDKQIKIYKDHYHQLHNELSDDKAKVLQDITDWLIQRT
ncbi:hypothetical protein FSP39_002224 [Pinctada imbricata]|uniref:Serine aminopeptidase S33 domain-containing protein n=1 Tax=Pinctada imbricata TaxID=66713 RepID=A0AA88YGD9_PINIB|nr:hypothetical protein FSP39_002224 [Pinctada imbricata]